ADLGIRRTLAHADALLEDPEAASRRRNELGVAVVRRLFRISQSGVRLDVAARPQASDRDAGRSRGHHRGHRGALQGPSERARADRGSRHRLWNRDRARRIDARLHGQVHARGRGPAHGPPRAARAFLSGRPRVRGTGKRDQRVRVSRVDAASRPKENAAADRAGTFPPVDLHTGRSRFRHQPAQHRRQVQFEPGGIRARGG
ncbi:MAG: hypothetical protein H6Q78_1786, partial [Candidatus Krumholzibacteriota bacterium]|nr:hypothetical protein [Candidatus Krumholzibacteriota bacterium]